MQAPLSTLADDRDIRRVLRRLGFARDEISYLVANKVYGEPRRALGRRFGWSKRRVEATRRRAARKFEKFFSLPLKHFGVKMSQRFSELEYKRAS